MKAISTQRKSAATRRYQPLRWILGIAILLLVQGKASAQPVSLLFNPTVTTVTVGQTFTVDVIVDFTSPGTYNAVGAFINFNNTQLEVVSTPTVPGATVAALPSEVPFAAVATMNSTGRIDYTRFTLGASPTTDLVLFTVTLRALTSGVSTLVFNAPVPRESGAFDGGVNVSDISSTGTVNINAAGACGGTLANSASCSGTFSLALTNTTGTGPYDLVINGTTYNDIAAGTPFTVAPVAETLFGNGPGGNDQNDAAGVELGVRFNSSQNGYITGLRFFGPMIISGTYTGHLWTSTGTLLATATFTGVTANDWNEVTFPTPVRVTAGTDYVASYYTSSGRYTAVTFAFDTDYSNGGSLTVPAGGAPNGSGYSPTGNGVFDYNTVGAGPNPVFPTGNYYNGNYYVDVNFVPESSSFALTSLSDNTGCTVTGSPIQNLIVISPDCSTLPVTLVNLSASPQDNKINLRWTTASEINNTGFRVQRSTEGGSSRWEDLTFVAGAGNSTSTRNYSYSDLNLAPGRYYYRLVQVDIDGQFKITPVVSATINGKGGFVLEQNFPNPFRSEATTIRFSIPRSSQVNLSVFDMHGRLIKVLLNGKMDLGSHVVPFEPGSLGRGVYYYKLQAGDFTDVKKMTIQ